MGGDDLREAVPTGYRAVHEIPGGEADFDRHPPTEVSTYTRRSQLSPIS